jgi:beta-glucosidase
VHLPPYQKALDEGAQIIMVSFSSWGGLKMHAQKYLLTDVLKGELGFEGFLVSDWAGMDQIAPDDYRTAIVTSINAGVDMNMVPEDYERFINTLTQAVEDGDVTQERIDDAVSRILTAKILMGLFERPVMDDTLLDTVGSPEHRELGREAVRKSLVLLKNENAALPIARNTPLIYLAGSRADDVGSQSGGWTLSWAGQTGDLPIGTSIWEALQDAVDAGTTLEYSPFADFEAPPADLGIVVVGEDPYAEGPGDTDDLSLSEDEQELIATMRRHSKELVVILISGRPMLITDQLPLADAFVAAWLPGTEAAGITDVLFGDHPFTGKLPFTWPRSMDQLPFDFDNLPTEGCSSPLFPFGYGLDTTAPGPVDWRGCPPL